MKSKIEYLGFAYDIDNINVNFMINDTKKIYTLIVKE